MTPTQQIRIDRNRRRKAKRAHITQMVDIWGRAQKGQATGHERLLLLAHLQADPLFERYAQRRVLLAKSTKRRVSECMHIRYIRSKFADGFFQFDNFLEAWKERNEVEVQKIAQKLENALKDWDRRARLTRLTNDPS
ncbi:MAG: hypothetical protein ACXIUV_07090 [Alkalilacustris sp.]